MEQLDSYFDEEAINQFIISYDTSKSDYLNGYKQAYRDRDEAFILKSYKSFVDKGAVQIPSPVDGSLSTAVSSFCGGGRHYILMKSENSHYWILIQCMSFIDCIIFNNSIHYFTYKEMARVSLNALGRALKYFSSSSPESTLKGFYIQHNRPFHFFYDQLKSAVSIEMFFDAETVDKYPFYIKKPFVSSSGVLQNASEVKNINVEVNQSGITLKPLVYSQFYTNAKQSSWTRGSMNKMESLLYSSSNRIKINTKDYDLVLWIGITGQKRSWIEQVEGYSSIIQQLSKNIAKILVVVDGWTSTKDEIQAISGDNEVYLEIASRCSDYADFISVIGLDYSTKVSVCKDVDFFIANAGTGSMVPLRICKKDGVLHSNKSLFTFPDDYVKRGQNIKFVNKNLIGVKDNEGVFEALISYQINWKVVYNLLITLINETKGTEFCVLTYDDNDFVYLEDSPIDSANFVKDEMINIRLSSEDKYVDALRDFALVLEKKGEIYSARNLMREANKLRPSGKFIEGKLRNLNKLIISRSKVS